MPNSILSKARKLFDESNEVLLNVHNHLQGYYRTSAMVDALLDEHIEKSLDEQAKKILKMFNQSQVSNAGRIRSLFKKLDEMDEVLMRSDMAHIYRNKFESTDTVRPSSKYLRTTNKEELYKILEDRYLPVWYYYRSLCAIYISGIFQKDYSILLCFLDKPQIAFPKNDYVMEFARHVGMELNGKVVPLTGIVESLLDMSQAQLDKEMNKIKTAKTVWDRLFMMTDHVSLFSSHIMVADCVLDFAGRNTKENERSFVMAKEYFTS